MDNYYSKKFH